MLFNFAISSDLFDVFVVAGKIQKNMVMTFWAFRLSFVLPSTTVIKGCFSVSLWNYLWNCYTAFSKTNTLTISSFTGRAKCFFYRYFNLVSWNPAFLLSFFVLIDFLAIVKFLNTHLCFFAIFALANFRLYANILSFRLCTYKRLNILIEVFLRIIKVDRKKQTWRKKVLNTSDDGLKKDFVINFFLDFSRNVWIRCSQSYLKFYSNR